MPNKTSHKLQKTLELFVNIEYSNYITLNNDLYPEKSRKIISKIT